VFFVLWVSVVRWGTSEKGRHYLVREVETGGKSNEFFNSLQCSALEQPRTLCVPTRRRRASNLGHDAGVS
jgi:hypothetical protein